MPREYRHIKQYEKEILELEEKGLTKREIGEKLGFSKEQIKGVLKRKHRKDEKPAWGVVPKKKGRPAKDSVVTEEDTIADLRFALNRYLPGGNAMLVTKPM